MGSLFGGGPSIPAPQLTNIPQLQQTAQQAASANALNSYALENQLYPGYGNFAQGTFTALGNGLNQNQATPVTPTTTATALASNPLLQQAGNTASSLLGLNGQLPPDVAEQISRQAAETAGQAGMAGGSPTQNAVGESLGLNSLQLLNQSLSNATNVGGAIAGANAQQQTLMNAVNEFNSATVPQINTAATLGAGSLLNNISLPVSGLSPGDIASVSQANTSATNAYNQQVAQLQAGQQNAGLGFLSDLIGVGLAPSAGGTSLLGGLGSNLASGVSSLASGVSSLFTPSNPFSGAQSVISGQAAIDLGNSNNSNVWNLP